jgi:dihydrofolate reductase
MGWSIAGRYRLAAPLSMLLRLRQEWLMRTLTYAINITLDGCCDHTAGMVDAESHAFWTERMARADALIYGRVTYGMMESGWRAVAEGARPDWALDWMLPFADVIHPKKKYVVSSTLKSVDWNAELLPADFITAIRRLKEQPGGELLLGGVTLPRALAAAGLIDEYELVVMPRIAGRGPTLLSGLAKFVDLTLIGQQQFTSGAVLMRYAARP